MTLPNKELLRPDEVAQHFGVSRSTIYLWIDHGLLVAEKYQRIIRITRESVENFRLEKKLHPLD